MQGECIVNCGTLEIEPEVWAAPMENGDLAIVVVNWGFFSHTPNIKLAQLGLSGTYIIRDLELHENILTTETNFYTEAIPAHGSKTYRLRASSPQVYL